jgi:hypothetical protein
MILSVCLGILLVGILIIPIASAGCGPGTVLIDGVCELVPTPESSTACGPGTVMVAGVCELDEKNESSSMSIEPIYIIIAVVAIGGVIGGVFAVRKGSKIPKPAREGSKKKETDWGTMEIKSTPSEFCQSCGASLKPGARFCGMCGTSRP